jgi:hypothetical protein
MTEEAKQLGNKRVGIYDDNPAYISQGITLREYYAGLFTQTLIGIRSGSNTYSQDIEKAIAIADILLEKLSKEETK